MQEKTPTWNQIPQKTHFTPHEVTTEGNGDRLKPWKCRKFRSEGARAIYSITDAILIVVCDGIRVGLAEGC